MRRTQVLISAAMLGAAALIGVGAAPPSRAVDDWGLNGTYTATSNGEWAKTNDAYHDQASVRSTWTVTTTCSYPTECTGTVTSDWGWTAPIYQRSGIWYVKRPVPNWQPCPDGTATPGLQTFRFFPSAPDGGAVDPTSSTLLGEDQTAGVSGACGRSLAVFITMPFKLVKAG